MRACWLKWVGRDWSISADYNWLNYSDANINNSELSVGCWGGAVDWWAGAIGDGASN